MSAQNELTEEQLVYVREFCGYPPKRKDGNVIVMGVLFTQSGELEYALEQLTPIENGRVVKYIDDLKKLQTGIMAAVDNADTSQAAVWTRNKDEMEEREGAYQAMRFRLCNFIGVKPGPFLAQTPPHWVM